MEKDRNDLKNNKGARVPGTLEWITADTSYQCWQSSGPDSLWITAGPGRGKTMLSLFILEDLEQYISTPRTLPGSTVQEEHGKKADLYYFFCSTQEGSRRGAVAVFRSLIHQIVSKHEDLMKYVLDYLGNNRPIHADNQPDNEHEKQSRNQEKEHQRSHSASMQNTADHNFPTQAKLLKNLLRSPAAVKRAPENNDGMHKAAQSDKESENQPVIESKIFQNILGKTHKEESKNEPMKQLGTQPESGLTNSADTPERDSPKSRQLELLDVSELSFILRKLIQELAVDKVYFLLDGVDECVKEEQEALTSTMLKLWDVKPGKFKLLVVSQLIGGMGRTPTIRLEETEQTKGDIEKFVSKSIEQINVDGFEEIQQEVEHTLVKRAEGTFLWVSLVMREIEKKKTCGDICTASKINPLGLNGKYSHMLQQIDPANQRQAYKILRWVTAAIRPLTLQELSEVIEAPPSKLMSPEQAVRDGITSCEGLVKIQGGEVTLVHSSAKNTLLCDETSNGVHEGFPVALRELHYELAQSCYDDILHSGLSQSELKVSDLSDKEERKMLEYAIKHWIEHVQGSDWAEKNFDPHAEFFRKDSKLRKNWWTAYLEDSQNDNPKNFNVASLLHLAAYFGIVTWVKQAFDGKTWLAKKGAILMELDHYYRTPLHIAVEQGHGPVVSLLLDHGLDIEFREASLFATPLHLAARNGRKNICEILLDRKARINARNRFDSTPLTEAARGGHLEVVKLLVQQGADVNGSIDKKQRSLYRHIENVPGYTKRALGEIDGLAYAERSTPVIEAARQNHAEIIRYLVRHGRANIEAKTLEGFNALHVAAYHGQMKSLEMLVELGADIEKKDDSTRTALFMASWQNHADVVKWLLDRDADSDPITSSNFTPLFVASKNGYVDPIRILLEAHAKIEHRDEKGLTSLAVAARFGKVAAVKLLIDYNAKVNAQDQSGNIALIHAIQENLTDDHVEMVQLLMKHDANINHKNQSGLTPLMKAAELSNGDAASIAQNMLENGAAIDTRDNEGRTALMHAFRGGSNKTRELLLNKGAAIEAKDDLGDTALIIAAGYSNPDAVNFLLERGADIEVRDRYGFTPLIKAAKCGLDDTVNLLLDRGAQIDAVDNEGKAAIDHAATRERGNIIKLLKSRGASGHNLTVFNRAAATLSNVMYWTEEACREWERDWEIATLKQLGRTLSDEGSDDASTMEQNEQGVTGDMDKSFDVDSERSNVKLMDGGSAQTSVEE